MLRIETRPTKDDPVDDQVSCAADAFFIWFSGICQQQELRRQNEARSWRQVPTTPCGKTMGLPSRWRSAYMSGIPVRNGPWTVYEGGRSRGNKRGGWKFKGLRGWNSQHCIFCRTWEKDFLTMIGSQRRVSCKTGVLALAFSCSHVILVDFVCHSIDCLQSHMLCERICASKDVGTGDWSTCSSNEYWVHDQIIMTVEFLVYLATWNPPKQKRFVGLS